MVKTQIVTSRQKGNEAVNAFSKSDNSVVTFLVEFLFHVKVTPLVSKFKEGLL